VRLVFGLVVGAAALFTAGLVVVLLAVF